MIRDFTHISYCKIMEPFSSCAQKAKWKLFIAKNLQITLQNSGSLLIRCRINTSVNRSRAGCSFTHVMSSDWFQVWSRFPWIKGLSHRLSTVMTYEWFIFYSSPWDYPAWLLPPWMPPVRSLSLERGWEKFISNSSPLLQSFRAEKFSMLKNSASG